MGLKRWVASRTSGGRSGRFVEDIESVVRFNRRGASPLKTPREECSRAACPGNWTAAKPRPGLGAKAAPVTSVRRPGRTVVGSFPARGESEPPIAVCVFRSRGEMRPRGARTAPVLEKPKLRPWPRGLAVRSSLRV